MSNESDVIHPGQTTTVVNDRIRRNTTIYNLHGAVLGPFISVSYTETYGDIRRKKNDRVLSQYTEEYGPCTVVYERIRIP